MGTSSDVAVACVGRECMSEARSRGIDVAVEAQIDAKDVAVRDVEALASKVKTLQ